MSVFSYKSDSRRKWKRFKIRGLNRSLIDSLQPRLRIYLMISVSLGVTSEKVGKVLRNCCLLADGRYEVMLFEERRHLFHTIVV